MSCLLLKSVSDMYKADNFTSEVCNFFDIEVKCINSSACIDLEKNRLLRHLFISLFKNNEIKTDT